MNELVLTQTSLTERDIESDHKKTGIHLTGIPVFIMIGVRLYRFKCLENYF